jgi:hypothetical protein
MIYIPPIPELSVYGVIECGVPNKERICLRPSEEVNLAHFALLLAFRNNVTSELTPINDHFYWFGEKKVAPPSWIIIFTGEGQNKTVIEKGVNVHIFFWGKNDVLFNAKPNVTIVPLIFRIGSFSAVPLLPTPEQIKQISNK